MLHEFVAASQAQSRSWKTYMKTRLSCLLARLITFFVLCTGVLCCPPSVLLAASTTRKIERLAQPSPSC